jgi:uracil-DNA glycosylase
MLYRFEVNKKCTKCSLKCNEGTVSGQSEVPFPNVKLIVVSNYPGNREYTTGLSLADNLNRKATVPDSNRAAVGAGEYLRYCLTHFINSSKEIPEQFKPIESFTYFTNAIKCTPQHGRDKVTVTEKHIKTCRDSWLTKELDLFNPRVPILVLGSEPVKAVLGIDKKLYENRNRVNYYKDHPVIVSTNPVDWEKYVMKYVPNIEESRGYIVKLMKSGAIKKYKKRVDQVIGVKRWQALPGSPLYFVKQDLQLIKEQVIKYINN